MIEGFDVLVNYFGMVLGMFIEYELCFYMFFSGLLSELCFMFENEVKFFLLKKMGLNEKIVLIVFCFFGIGEF